MPSARTTLTNPSKSAAMITTASSVLAPPVRSGLSEPRKCERANGIASTITSTANSIPPQCTLSSCRRRPPGNGYAMSALAAPERVHPPSLRARFGLDVGIRRRAGADQIPISVSALDARDSRPELEVTRPVGWKRGLLPRVGMRPRTRRHPTHWMGRFLEHVVLPVGRTGLYFPDLLTDGDHRIAEPVELLFRLALGRLDHQRSGHGERDRWRVEAVVHQPLRDVFHVDAARLLHHARIDNALVRDCSVRALVEYREMRLEQLGGVVGVQYRDPPRVLQSF